ncbi:serine protease 53-like [Anopheles cruzii]|uniref:serine protease 53-like n=1 Tax=Anopheles cruzii TaxID=68878 RepID=UPI0022EC7065|nr:serine protease 53-like [Anopheles cruzii]
MLGRLLVAILACGQRKLGAMGLIIKGTTTFVGEYPWHVALFRKGFARTADYICGGSIISPNFVLTAAHCIEDPRPSQYLFRVGLHNLQNASDPDTVGYNVSEIIVHPEYDRRKFSSDIALLRSDGDISFADVSKVLPICLWANDETGQLGELLDKAGYVAGWGFNENYTVSDVLQSAKLRVVDRDTCWRGLPEHNRFLLEHSGKLCARGWDEGVNVCSGDSGGGLYFVRDGVWYLRGIVSAAPRQEHDTGETSCNPMGYATYTDVAQFRAWIDAHQAIVNQRNLLNLEHCGDDRFEQVQDEHAKPLFQQYPWNVLLEFFQKDRPTPHLLCGGVLIHRRFVLTVGHCVDGILRGYELRTVRLGEFNTRTALDGDPNSPDTTTLSTQSIGIERIIINPRLNQPSYGNNLALLRLRHDADTRKPNVAPICLPSLVDYTQTNLTLTGWMREKFVFPELARDSMNLSSAAECRSQYAKVGVQLQSRAQDSFMFGVFNAPKSGFRCKNYAAGSALQYIKFADRKARYFLAGLLTFNFPSCHQDGCEMFASITNAGSWIQDEVNKLQVL